MRNHPFSHPARAALLVLALSGLCLCLPEKGANAEEGTGNMVFFKGGYVMLNSNRGGGFFTDCGVGSATCGQNNASTGWYVGAGLDLVLSKDNWGMANKTWALGDIGLQFNRISSHTVTGGVTAATGTGGPAKTQLTSVTIDVAPKIKFMEGSAFRPWIIPIGLDIMVISAPTNQTQYLDVGVEFGVGAEYEVWKAFKNSGWKAGITSWRT